MEPDLVGVTKRIAIISWHGGGGPPVKIPHFTAAVSADSMTLNCCPVLVSLRLDLVEERGTAFRIESRASTEAKPHFTSSM